MEVEYKTLHAQVMDLIMSGQHLFLGEVKRPAIDIIKALIQNKRIISVMTLKGFDILAAEMKAFDDQLRAKYSTF